MKVMERGRTRWVGVLFLAGGFVVGGCTAPGGPDQILSSEFPGPPDAGPPPPPLKLDKTCRPALSSQPMPARSSVVGASGGVDTTSVQTYFTDTLFEDFKSVCGGCHFLTNSGGFQVTRSSFASLMTQAVLTNNIMSDNPATYMPPSGGGTPPFSQRPANDPVVRLATLLQAWIAQGYPDEMFTLPGSSTPPPMGFALTPKLGAQLTNIGSCVPGKDLYAQNKNTMDDLDALFARAQSITDLPPTLDQTDLVTLDSDELAQNGVISYAPAYPLWSDDAGKMRYVRVPRGQSITFDKATQKFTIPPNTRFYKTFLKEVVDASGTKTFRKIETRIIVARPDMDLPDGVKQTALFGTYLWDADEKQATLHLNPLNDGTPFSDLLTTYVTDEPKYDQVVASVPPGRSVKYAVEVQNAGLLRHYAVPGRDRCIQCHMGSPSEAFILGFTPLQIARPATGTPGLIEPADGDELTQLQRLIDYGVITGMTSPDDVLSLDKAEGTRAPRNEYELTAQAYMVGNCSHCHNPRGFPSTKAPELKDVLNFLPSPTGGVFQFPLDKMSPIRFRGFNQDIPIPYITPAVRDLPATGSIMASCANNDCTDEGHITWVQAPWRSLIYRNVDTPFDYTTADHGLFPHMPLNTPGYDCRAAGIMGDWMVSIPSRIIHPNLDLNALPLPGRDGSSPTDYPSPPNTDPQPYAEVKPGDDGYDKAKQVAGLRLAGYHTGSRYNICPAIDTNDILDPIIAKAVANAVPLTPDIDPNNYPNDPNSQLIPAIAIPLHAHWTVTDTTNPPGDWAPKRTDWQTALVDQVVAQAPPSAEIVEDLKNVIAALAKPDVVLAPVRDALTTEIPFGLWKQDPGSGCTFDGVPTVDSFQGADRPAWMDLRSPQPDAKAPVYMISPGEAIFSTICANCHGAQADSKGILADEVTLLTGGLGRVADFRDGLFGPVTSPGMNRTKVFQDAATQLGVTADDLGARYMAWMALGGTTIHLPTAVLDLVSSVPVLGESRGVGGGNFLSADMLEMGLKLCTQVLASDRESTIQLKVDSLLTGGHMRWSDGGQTGLIQDLGDAEMWLRICSLGNRKVVRSIVTPGNLVQGTSLYWADNYPADAPVLDQHGVKTSFAADPGNTNIFPMCGTTDVPCPPGYVQGLPSNNQLKIGKTADSQTDYVDARAWAARGAINAAMAVFLYLDGLEHGNKPQAPYNHCELRGIKGYR
jgi:mono/diheme cytochrome c family protein